MHSPYDRALDDDGDDGVPARRVAVTLAPIADSITDEVFPVEIEVKRADGRLTFGDLRRAALTADSADLR